MPLRKLLLAVLLCSLLLAAAVFSLRSRAGFSEVRWRASNSSGASCRLGPRYPQRSRPSISALGADWRAALEGGSDGGPQFAPRLAALKDGRFRLDDRGTKAPLNLFHLAGRLLEADGLSGERVGLVSGLARRLQRDGAT
ncbi:MAG: hypothetical protein ABGY71_09015 [bacterium]|jgi:hypothetical protein|nr:hypothetical protein [Planctomycetota bacterium]HIL52694.1 hypothetical protein [Planctomycetota bacterium]